MIFLRLIYLHNETVEKVKKPLLDMNYGPIEVAMLVPQKFCCSRDDPGVALCGLGWSKILKLRF